MYVSKKVRAAVVQRLCDHGGTLTIDKADRAQQHIWGVLDAMAVLGGYSRAGRRSALRDVPSYPT